jgi:hypothetical protein
VRSNGQGGRNVEWLLSAGITLNGHPRIHALAGDTDGVDGQEEIAGALGPASSDKDIVRGLFMAGVDVFRLNFSHGSADDHRARFAVLRELAQETGRPIGILADLQGPKLRVGVFADGPIVLVEGQAFRLDLNAEPGNVRRVRLPHPEIFTALVPGAELLLDDGKLRLEVVSCGPDFAETRVVVGGKLSERKGVKQGDKILFRAEQGVAGLVVVRPSPVCHDNTNSGFAQSLLHRTCAVFDRIGDCQ